MDNPAAYLSYDKAFYFVAARLSSDRSSKEESAQAALEYAKALYEAWLQLIGATRGQSEADSLSQFLAEQAAKGASL